MTYLIAEPQIMAAVAADVDGIGLETSAANAAATDPTSGLLAPAAAEASAAVTQLFVVIRRIWPRISGVVKHATAFHNEFTQALTAAGNAYASAEPTPPPWARRLRQAVVSNIRDIASLIP